MSTSHLSSQSRPVELLINRSAMQHNLARVRALVPQASVMAVIKADAYGHGMEVAADALADADQFGVTSLDDVIRLQNHGVDKPIVPLSPWLDTDALQQFNRCVTRQTHLTVFERTQLEYLESAEVVAPLTVWLKADTGMGRTGFLPAQIGEVLERLHRIPAVTSVGLLSHLANADVPEHPLNQIQIARFDELRSQYSFTATSLLNSGGLIGHPQQAGDLVRPGVMLYGASPLVASSASDLDLRPAQTLCSRLISRKTLPAGNAVGYGSTVTLDRPSLIGYVACGYGDGYPRHAPSGTPVLVAGQRVPLIGRVSMDLLAIDLTDLATPKAAGVGAEVVLWGEGNPIDDVAAAAGTIAYELMCSPTNRVLRRVVG